MTQPSQSALSEQSVYNGKASTRQGVDQRPRMVWSCTRESREWQRST